MKKGRSRTLLVFLFGFSYYGVLKIRFVLSRIFGDFLYQFSYNPGFLLKRDAVKADQFVLKFANWLRSKYGRRLETVRGVGLIDPEIVFVSRREDVAERIRMEPKYVPAETLWINPSLTDIDMTRRYSILSPPGLDGPARARAKTIKVYRGEVHYEEISHRAPRATAGMGR